MIPVPSADTGTDTSLVAARGLDQAGASYVSNVSLKLSVVVTEAITGFIQRVEGSTISLQCLVG
jgi:hypothetical protein